MSVPGTRQTLRTVLGQAGPRRRAALLAPVLAGGLLVAGLSVVAGQQVHRNGFEGQELQWVKGTADAAFRETAHAVTDLHAHGGQRSEYIALTAEQGSFIYYFYSINKAPVSEELNAGVFVKANRPGIRFLARLVLPHEKQAGNLQEPLTTLLRGDVYQLVGRWQRLELRNPVKLAREQQQFLRAELKRDVNFTDAYIDRLILNVYGGPGQTEVWTDDLEVGPVEADAPFKTTSRPTTAPAPRNPDSVLPRTPARTALVELQRDHLLVGGKPFFVRGIRHSDTPLKTLRDAGINTLWVDARTPLAVLEEAIALGFWVVPALNVTAENPRPVSPEEVRSEVAGFGAGDAVLFWDLGGGLVDEQKDQVQRATKVVHTADPQRLTGADVWDGLRPYSRTIDLVGVHRWPLMTTLELPQYHEWLVQRGNLGWPGKYTWTWVQTHLPDWFCRLVYDRPSTAGFNEPVGPQPEQIRLLTYTALASGCRGVGFWSDRFLANSHQGRDRLLEMALLNLELQMLEPLLVGQQNPGFQPRWIGTSIPEVKAAVLRTDYGILVLPIWLGNGSQFVPGQSATAKLTMVVPDVPPTADPWLISPVDVRTVPINKREVGGTNITLPEFSLTAALLFTSSNNPTGIVVRLQNQVRALREQAAQWAKDLADVELEKVSRIEAQLEQANHRIDDGQKLLEEAQRRRRLCLEHWNNHDYREAYLEAERVVRPLRILMRAQWEQAIKGFDSPVASPFAVSFFTLPRHWEFVDRLKPTTAGPNLLPGGNFEAAPSRPDDGWSWQKAKLDAVVLHDPQRVAESPAEGKQCLKLMITPQFPQNPPRALERTFLAVTSPPVRLPPGTPVRVSGWVRIPADLGGSVDGALLYDSAAGEPLGIRLTGATGWKKYTLYRVVPDSGVIQVTLALTGMGAAYFDDIRVEALSQTRTAAASPSR